MNRKNKGFYLSIIRIAVLVLLLNSLGLVNFMYGRENNGYVLAGSKVPAPIEDLKLGYITDSSINLSWTTTGENGNVGAASYYEARYSTEPIDEDNWGLAIAIEDLPTPYPAGYEQAFNVTGLQNNTKYYFGIKAVNGDGNASPISNVEYAITGSGEPGGKIVLDPTMIVSEIDHPDACKYVDEQEIAGDPKNGAGGKPSTQWGDTPIWGPRSSQLPRHFIIDLGAEYELTDVYLFDTNNTGDFIVSTGEPGDWIVQFTDPLTAYMSWKKHVLDNVRTRYVRLTQASGGSYVSEVVLYGNPLEAVVPPCPPEPQLYKPTTTMDQFIGINAFIDDSLETMKVAGFVREYHNWLWVESEQELNKFNPAYAGGGWDFDAYYEMLKEAGITVCPAIQGGTMWAGVPEKRDSKPVLPGEDPDIPESYASHASHMYQYAARYGSKAVPDENLKLAEDQERLTGLGLLEYFEDWNEQNADWAGNDPYFTPYNYAAMASADYDGHLNTMGDTYGVKNADPDAKLVMGGLAGINLNYIKKINDWAKWFREGDFPADVLNVHTYCTTGSVGVSPEEGNLRETVENLVRYRDQYIQDKEVWLTEFGYDTNPGSPNRAPAIGDKSQFQVQGEWLVRSYLLLAASGIDRAVMYMIRDVDGDDTTKYSSSGLVSSPQTGGVPKKSWYYIYTLKNTLEGLRYIEDVPSGEDNVLIQSYGDENGDAKGYVLWSPTSDNTVVRDYEFTLPKSMGQVKLVELVDKKIEGEARLIEVGEDNTIRIDVSESPIFIMQEEENIDVESPTIPENLKSTRLNETSIKLEWDASNDNFGVAGYWVYRDGDLVADVDSAWAIITNLTPGVEYSYTVSAYDEAGNWSLESEAITASTTPSGNPKISVTPDMLIYNRDDSHTNTPEALFDGVRGGSDLGWAAWSSVSNFKIDLGEYYSISRMDLYTMSWTGDAHTIHVSGGADENNLVDLWSYVGKGRDEVVSFDILEKCESVRYIHIRASGAYRELEIYGRKIGDGLSEPMNLRAEDIGQSEVTLKWDSPAEGIATGYKVYMDDEEIVDINDTSATITGLEPDTEYTFAVSAYDGEGNGSGQSQPLIIRTESLEEKNIVEDLEISGVPSIVEAGEEIEVTITAKQAANLAGIDLKLGYNEELFELKEITLDENFDLDLGDFNYEVKDGVIRLINLILCDGFGYTGDIDMIKLVMKAKDKDALTSISILEGTKLSGIDADLYVLEESIEEVLVIANSDITGGGTAINDLVLIAKAFGLSQGDVGYDPRLDMNKDGIIDIVDIAYVSARILKG